MTRLLLLLLPRGDGGGGSLLCAGRTLRCRHGRGGFLSASASTDLAALRALLAEVLQHFRREFLLRHASILNRVLANSNISLYLTGSLRYNQDMKAIGYVRVSTEKQADSGVSLEAQSEKVRAMAVVQGAELAEIIIDAGESAKSLNRPGMARLLSLVDSGVAQTVIIAKLDRLTRSVKDLAELLERFNRRSVSLVSVAESLDTGTAAGRLVLNIMTAVSQWEREAIGERTRDAMRHKRANGERVGTNSLRLPNGGGRLTPGGGPGRARRTVPHPGIEGGRLYHPADCGRTQPARLQHPAWNGLAVPVRGGSAPGGGLKPRRGFCRFCR